MLLTPEWLCATMAYRNSKLLQYVWESTFINSSVVVIIVVVVVTGQQSESEV
jgi:hypothetical protein